MDLVLVGTILLGSLFRPVEVAKYDIEERLSYLAFCESSNNPLAYVADDNGSPSIGLYQFKQTTWDWAMKRYRFVDIDFDSQAKQRIATTSIHNPEHQKLVAKAIIKDGRGKRTWENCWNKANKYFGD